MKTKLFVTALALIASSSMLHAQSIIHPVHIVDNGGGKSTAGGLTLQASIGQPAVQASSSGGINLESGCIPGFRIFSGSTTTLTQELSDGWNLVSVPLAVSNNSKSFLYPAATSAAFSYNGGYVSQTTMQNGIGFWLKFSAASTNSISGTTMLKETIDVAARWNMIGILSYPTLQSDVTPLGTAIVSNYFGYSDTLGYFVEDTLKPGFGYWMKVSQGGKLALKTSTSIPPGSPLAAKLSRGSQSKGIFSGAGAVEIKQLTIRDARGRERPLYFSTCKDATLVPTMYELPPIPPGSALDVRYTSQRMLEIADEAAAKDFTLEISNAVYPVTIKWDAMPSSDGMAALVIDTRTIDLTAAGQVQVQNEESNIRLRLTSGAVHALPTTYALRQNYPNPFNPITQIRYELPKSTSVNLTVFDVLGREVVTLVDEVQEAGYKSAEWNASDKPTGVYFYQLRANGFLDTRKLLLLR